MEQITESGSLVLGVLVDGVRHRDFVLRAPTVQDNIDATQEIGTSNAVHLSAAIFALQLVSLGTLKREPKQPPKLAAGEVMPTYINTALVCRMHPADFNALEAASMRLEKKLLSEANALTGGPSAALPSPSTASPSTTS